MIITDEKLLRTKCEAVKIEAVANLREELELELKQSAERGHPGIGLAAPQIGKYQTMAIVRVPDPSGMIKIDLVNCRIKAGYDETFFDGEGCLSFPGQYVRTKRFQEIHVVDNLVYPYSFIATGLLAVVIQHELQHLDGILLPDVMVK